MTARPSTLRHRDWLAAVLLIACVPPLHAESGAISPVERSTRFGTWGFDVAAMDRSVAPGDDFFRFANGTWLRTTEIPPDRAAWGEFAILAAESERDVREAIEAAERANPAAGSVGRKVVDGYRAYLDTMAIERRGIDAARADLSAIERARSHEDVARIMAAGDMASSGPLAIAVVLDPKAPDRYVLGVYQSGLGMPDRDYYLNPDARLAQTRREYRDYAASILVLAGFENAAESADAILALETGIAQVHWPREKSRDRNLTYNPRTRDELVALAPDFPWNAALDAYGAAGEDRFVVAQLDAVPELAKLFRGTPVATWRAYLAFHLLDAMSDVLPKAVDDAAFAFNARVLRGQVEQRERWKRAVAAMSGRGSRAAMGEATGQLYVARKFSPEAKAAVAKMVDNLRAAYRERITRLSWMTDATRKEALAKLARMNVKIGYPDRWRDYADLVVSADDAYGNRKREIAFNRARDLRRLSRGADRAEWNMPPQIVNAYYSPPWNEIVFPAAILQPPFFDPNADDAVNYGGIGAVIGHEMGHGFDDQGSKSDADGVLRDWWNARDRERFDALTAVLVEQYSAFEARPGLRVNGRLTLGENIGDLGGLNVALEAYRISLAGSTPATIDGFSPWQRFFLGNAQVWRGKLRDEALRARVVADPHAPNQFRVNGPVRNMNEWYDAFDVNEQAKLYLPPERRVRIW